MLSIGKIKRYIVAFSLVLMLLGILSVSSHADESDYIVGLNAYSDELYDIARISLEDYIQKGQKPANVTYAKYVLYQLYFKEKEFELAEKIFAEIKDIKDKRFDKRLIRREKVRYLVKTDCAAATKLVKAKYDVGSAALFVASDCQFDQNLYKAYLIKGTKDQTRIQAMLKSAEYPKSVKKLFRKTKIKNMNKKQLKYFGAYFYKHSDFDSFWKVYKNHKDSDMVNFALNRLWSLKKYDSFVKSYEFNKKYTMSPNNACRVIRLYNKSKTDFDCALIDTCYQKKDKGFYNSKLACLMKKKKTEEIRSFISSTPVADFKHICEYSEYLIANEYYHSDDIFRFGKCSQIDQLADILVDKQKYDEILSLYSGKSSDKAYFNISLAYFRKGDVKKAKLYKEKITDKNIKAGLTEF